MPSAQLGVLNDTTGFFTKKLAHRLSPETDDDQGSLTASSFCRRQRMGDHGNTTDRMEHFGQDGIHARALSGSQDNGSYLHWHLLRIVAKLDEFSRT
jgi:hypothetical protein